MALVDPKTPPRSDLEKMCGGNQRLVKAFEKLFDLIPSELNKGSDDVSSAQLSADNAAAQALLGVSLLMMLQGQIDLNALHPSLVIQSQDTFDLSPRSEQVTLDQIYPAYQSIGCNNFNLEIT
ncbi:hypothetical protein [Acinetobacter ursingii]|uniref:hypothetical protein n=1 Tax=Acinetobacter ursingii TaxID=108980 RepID=UPI001250971D|nr:hypothetical protein [Acinetobacter ursingii]MDU4393273.1 hypothetical protein [Acinetobacter ursingii]